MYSQGSHGLVVRSVIIYTVYIYFYLLYNIYYIYPVAITSNYVLPAVASRLIVEVVRSSRVAVRRTKVVVLK